MDQPKDCKIEETRNGIRLPHQVIVTAPGLLDMMYLPEELAEEMRVGKDLIDHAIQLGAPHWIDEDDTLYIHGTKFKLWVTDCRKPRRERRLENHEAYCPRCKADTVLTDITIKDMSNGALIQIRGRCTKCGITICRAGRR